MLCFSFSLVSFFLCYSDSVFVIVIWCAFAFWRLTNLERERERGGLPIYVKASGAQRAFSFLLFTISLFFVVTKEQKYECLRSAWLMYHFLIYLLWLAR